MKLIQLLMTIFVFNWSLFSQDDPRKIQLEEYLQKYKSPVSHLASVFVDVADNEGLDWRLLPALSIVESSAGKRMSNHNLFGWNSGKKQFSSNEESINVVGHALANAAWYKHKTFVSAMQTYNPANKKYAAKVREAMLKIDSGKIDILLVRQKPATEPTVQ